MATLVAVAGRELMLFASAGILLIGLDDLLLDLLWLVMRRREERPLFLADLSKEDRLAGALAIFVPAWDEAQVLPAMIRHSLSAWQGEDIRLYLGCYPNDAETLFAVSPIVAGDQRVRLVIGDVDGPTTKGDNLNRLWDAMIADEIAEQRRFAGIVLHDAEDVVHRSEIALYRAMLARYAMVQIPVLPLLGIGQQWIAGHYADEFAEAHGKDLALRARLDAPIPSAGVGCALTRDTLALLSLRRGGSPFRADSLTEDYEMGILVGTHGLRSTFAAAVDDKGDWIVSRGAFPSTIGAAVRQKARWIIGIALAGWDHLGWAGPRDGGWIARWMLWRDRRAPLTAMILLAAYAALIVGAVGLAGSLLFDWQVPAPGMTLRLLLALSGALMFWRLGMRGYFATRAYGLRQGLTSLPRAFVANVIAMLAARRAIFGYWGMLRSGEVVWDKTRRSAGDVALMATSLESRRP